MGAGIAEVFARHGRAVVGVERDDDALAAGRGHVERSTGRAVQRGRLSEGGQRALIGRITFTTDLAALGRCELVIEAVPELLDIKRDLIKRLDEIVATDTVLATNTSSLSVTEIANASQHPRRVVGMHFFNPAPVLKLVEVVRGERTDPVVVDRVAELARELGKSPVVCGDQAGFIANALLFGYLNQAAAMVAKGEATREEIDEAMREGCDYPMGPLALLDLIGLDTSVEILDRMFGETGDRRHEPAPILRKLVAEDKLGRKSGHGFYAYGEQADSPAAGSAAPPNRDEIVRALLLPYLADATQIRDAGYATADDIDTAMTLGCGLPKGPFAVLDELREDVGLQSQQ